MKFLRKTFIDKDKRKEGLLRSVLFKVYPRGIKKER
jgi:hypothetical protein